METSGASSNKLINQISVGTNAQKLLKTFSQNYTKAPYFDPTINILNDLLLTDEKNLARLITSTIRKICSYLMIDTKLIVSSEVFRNQSLKKANRVIDICKQLGSDVYINAIGGKKLYFKEEFAEKGLQLSFLNSNPISYAQFGQDPFVPSLSIIDVMMFNPVEKIVEMLNQFDLID
jgi:hypothetical protein